ASAWSTNSFSRSCGKTRSPAPMWWPSPCIVGLTPRCLPMTTRSKAPTGGVLMRPAFQAAWQIVSQWVWNLRLELGHVLEPTPVRTTEFAPPVKEIAAEQAPVQGYEKQIARLAQD